MKITPRPSPRKTGYLPSLDGWRALAIVAVLMAHDLPWSLFGHSNEMWKGLGVHGVQLFFAISGVLITTRILEEESLAGFFDIKRFYIRRIFRIQPAALTFLTVTGLLIAFQVIHDIWHFWLAALFLYENYVYRGLPVEVGSFFSAHFWTLAVEEHFYILLSLFLFSIRRYRLAWLLTVYAALILAQQYAVSHGHFPGYVRRQTQWQLHALVFPAAFAVALRKPAFRHLVERWLKPWRAVLIWIAFVLVHRLAVHHSQPQVPAFGGRWIASELEYYVEIFFTLLVVATMLHKNSWTTRILELAPFRFIGRISYSIYLWHLLFFFRSFPDTNVTNPVLQALSGRPIKYIAAFSVAAASYYLIEKPMMRLGHRLAPPILPGRPELVEDTDAPSTPAPTGSYSLP